MKRSYEVNDNPRPNKALTITDDDSIISSTEEIIEEIFEDINWFYPDDIEQ